MQTAELWGAVRPEDIDVKLLRPALKPGAPPRVRVDMSQAKFIEPTTIVYLASVLASIRNAQPEVEFEFELPMSPDVRDFLRRWRFGSTIERVIGIGFADSLSSLSQSYRSLDAGRPRKYERAQRSGPGGRDVAITSSDFFETFVSDIEPRLPVDERRRWQSPEMRSILQRHLGQKASLIASGVVYEAVLNAVMHPGASKLVVSSAMQTQASKKFPNGVLTITFWDNGRSIPALLRDGLREAGTLRSEEFELYYARYALYQAPSHGDAWVYHATLDSGDEIHPGANEATMLMFATFPGVSSALSRAAEPANATLPMGPKMNRPGMGLYILTTSVVDSFGGELVIRSGNSFVSIKRANRADQQKYHAHYRCNSITDYLPSDSYVGNHLTARIPLMEAL